MPADFGNTHRPERASVRFSYHETRARLSRQVLVSRNRAHCQETWRAGPNNGKTKSGFMLPVQSLHLFRSEKRIEKCLREAPVSVVIPTVMG